jgi:starch synthase
MPYYGCVKQKGIKETGITVSLKMGNRRLRGSLLKGKLSDNCDIYFLRHNRLFGRSHPYGDSKGDFSDNDERFIFFNRALLELPELIGWQPDIVHVNDWHLGLVPALMKHSASKPLKNAPSVFTIHNIAYQGLFPKKSMSLTGLPKSLFNPGGVEWYENLGMLKAGIVYADAVTTVSPTYAKEILTKKLGFGLEGELKKRKGSLHGILNGIDTKEWNPKTDRLIEKNYDANHMGNKAKCKAALLKEFSLENLPGRPLIGIVSRIVEQKGFDIVQKAGDELMKLDFSLVVLGSGQPELEKFFTGLQKRYPKRVGVKLGFDNALAHRIEAGSDFFLMPSRFEPCGLNQMYSLRYGTIPIVRKTGGLGDTVKQWDPKKGTGNGFRFDDPTAIAMLAALKKALAAYGNKRGWKQLVNNAMTQDNSWGKSALRYIELYRKLLG